MTNADFNIDHLCEEKERAGEAIYRWMIMDNAMYCITVCGGEVVGWWWSAFAGGMRQVE